MIPSPMEYDILISAKPPSSEISLWVDGLQEVNVPSDLSWVNSIPNSNGKNLSGYKWYSKNRKIVGLSGSGNVLYRIFAH